MSFDVFILCLIAPTLVISLTFLGIKACIRQYFMNKRQYENRDLIT